METEQYWLDKDQVDALRERKARAGREIQQLHIQLTELRWGPERQRLTRRLHVLQGECREINDTIKKANLLRSQQELSAFDLDPNDPRGLLAAAYKALVKLHRQLVGQGGEWDPEDKALLHAITLYQQHDYVTLPGKLRFVHAQVES